MSTGSWGGGASHTRPANSSQLNRRVSIGVETRLPRRTLIVGGIANSGCGCNRASGVGNRDFVLRCTLGADHRLRRAGDVETVPGAAHTYVMRPRREVLRQIAN